MMAETKFPTYMDLLWPTLKALDETGGSASNAELSERVPSIMALPDEVLDALHNEGPLSRVEYQASWARSHLKYIKAVDNSGRSVWSLTEVGRDLLSRGSEEYVRELVRQARAEGRKARQLRKADKAEENDEGSDQEESWEHGLLTVMLRVEPAAFERLCQRVLRESGFTKVEVTGRTGDGGIDGAGVLRVNLLSFHVRFQCKRYAGSVGAREIRDFRGAMVGRADKGLFMTTGRFTKEAEREAVRDGAPAIDLIDGIELCNLLKRLDLGVRTETVENVVVRHDFFADL